jgi:ribosomal protein S18 acetylase RimI-like enzyme
MEAIIRPAVPEDAQTIIAYVQRLVEEPGIDILLSPGEFNMTVAEEQAFISGCNAAENSLFLVAEADGHIIGVLTCQGGKRRAVHHVTTLGMSVDKDWRDQGIGSRLMDYAVEWARRSGVVRRIELYVFARNARAIHLYEKYGFQIEGTHYRAIYRDGEYLDNLVMALLL